MSYSSDFEVGAFHDSPCNKDCMDARNETIVIEVVVADSGFQANFDACFVSSPAVSVLTALRSSN